jgi:flagellar biogenesis protein FliO
MLEAQEQEASSQSETSTQLSTLLISVFLLILVPAIFFLVKNTKKPKNE